MSSDEFDYAFDDIILDDEVLQSLNAAEAKYLEKRPRQALSPSGSRRPRSAASSDNQDLRPRKRHKAGSAFQTHDIETEEDYNPDIFVNGIGTYSFGNGTFVSSPFALALILP